jgi:hypothetical protein
VTRQSAGERRDNRIPRLFGAGEFWFFISLSPYDPLLIL